MDRFKALKEAIKKDDTLEFWGNACPVCPHCKKEITIADHELYHLYEEGTEEIDCPWCKLSFDVQTRAEIRFNTNEQEDLDDSEVTG